MTPSRTESSGASAIDFPGAMRIHLALPVRDLAASIAFYRALLGTEPTKQRPGYVKFEVEEPSVNLTLNQDAKTATPHPTQHFGIQVKHRNVVAAHHGRLRAAGVPTMNEEGVTCCFAVQDKVWAVDPDGHRWEIFVVLQADVPSAQEGHEPKVENTTLNAAESEAPCCP